VQQSAVGYHNRVRPATPVSEINPLAWQGRRPGFRDLRRARWRRLHPGSLPHEIYLHGAHGRKIDHHAVIADGSAHHHEWKWPERGGRDEALRAAKVYLLAGYEDGQLPFAIMRRCIQKSDAAIADCQTWIANNYISANPVGAMTEHSKLKPRIWKQSGSSKLLVAAATMSDFRSVTRIRPSSAACSSERWELLLHPPLIAVSS
jgi:hypothetical protein